MSSLRENQTAIYYLTGDDAKRLAASPQLEGFRARGVEVLLLSDPVDAFWVSTAAGYDGKPFKSVSQGAADIKSIAFVEGATAPAEASGEVATLFAFFKQTLEKEVAEVRASDRLTDSVACLIAPDFGPDRQLEKMLAAHGRVTERAKPILEVNPAHPLTVALAGRFRDGKDKPLVEDSAWLMLDEARLLEGGQVEDPPAFAGRLRRVHGEGAGVSSALCGALVGAIADRAGRAQRARLQYAPIEQELAHGAAFAKKAAFVGGAPILIPVNPAFARMGEENAFAVLAKAAELQRQGRDVINLGIGQPDFKTPPHIVEAAVKALRDGEHGYTDATGIAPLREAVAEDLHRRLGVEVSPDLVLIMPGGKVTMFMAILMFGEAGADIVYPDPGFPIYRSMIEFTGARPVPAPMREENGFAFSAEETLALMTPRDAARHPQFAGQPDRRRDAAARRSTSSSPGSRAFPTRRSCRTRSMGSSPTTGSPTARSSPIRRSATGSSCSTAGRRPTP